MINKDCLPYLRHRGMRAAAKPYASQRLRQLLRMAGNLLFDIAHDLFSFPPSAMNNEPAGAFRNGVTQEDNNDAQHCANAKYQPPAYGNGNNPGIQQTYGGGGADGRSNPEAAVDDEVYASTHPRWNQLINCGVDSGIFAADACACKSAEDSV